MRLGSSYQPEDNGPVLVRRPRDLQLPVVFRVNETVEPGLKVAAVQAEYSAGSGGDRNFTFVYLSAYLPHYPSRV